VARLEGEERWRGKFRSDPLRVCHIRKAVGLGSGRGNEQRGGMDIWVGLRSQAGASDPKLIQAEAGSGLVAGCAR
jgi:hypothetical protein